MYSRKWIYHSPIPCKARHSGISWSKETTNEITCDSVTTCSTEYHNTYKGQYKLLLKQLMVRQRNNSSSPTLEVIATPWFGHTTIIKWDTVVYC
jgi:hypothetical protein